MKRLNVVSLACVIALAVAGSAQAAPGWLGPTSLSASGDTTAGASVVSDPAGDAAAAWSSSTTGFSIDVRPAGGTWGTPVVVDPSGSGGVIGMDSKGDIVAVWSGTKVIRAAVRSAASGTWSPPVSLANNAGGLPESPHYVIYSLSVSASGRAAVLMSQASGGGAGSQPSDDLVDDTLASPTGTWSGLGYVAGDEAIGPGAIGIDGAGDLVAVWVQQDASGDPETVQAATLPAGAGTWSTPAELDGTDDTVPSLAVDAAGAAAATWTDGESTVQGAFLAAGGASPWQTTPLGSGIISQSGLNGASGPSGPPVAAIDGHGDAAAAWTTDDDGNFTIDASSRPASPGTWAPATAIAPESAAADVPAIGTDSTGDVAVAWSQAIDTTTNDVLEGVVRPASAASWPAPQQISTYGSVASAPSVALDGEGDAVAGWDQAGAADAAGYQAVAPALQNVTIPSAGSVGQPASFSASTYSVWAPLTADSWSFGDSSRASGDDVTHAYAQPGSYRVTVTDTDTLGNSSSQSGTITVAGTTGGATPGNGAPGSGQPGSGSGQLGAQHARLGKLRSHGATVIVPLRCTGASGQTCTGTARLTLSTSHPPKAEGKTTHARRRRMIPTRTITLATATYAVPAGHASTLTLTLGRRGRALLDSSYTLHAELRTTGSVVVSRSVTISYPRIRFGWDYKTHGNGIVNGFSEFSLTGLPAHTQVRITCHGRGCPFAHHLISQAHHTLNLLPLFARARLSPGTRIGLTVTAPNHVGDSATITVHADGDATDTVLCLPPGITKPVACR